MTNYIIFAEFECGGICRAEKITDAERKAADDGLADIIDIQDDPPKIYKDGTWEEVKKWGD